MVRLATQLLASRSLPVCFARAITSMVARCVVHYRSVCAPCSAPVRQRVSALGRVLPGFQNSLVHILRNGRSGDRNAFDEHNKIQTPTSVLVVAKALVPLVLGSDSDLLNEMRMDSEFEQQVFRAEWAKVAVAIMALADDTAPELFAGLLRQMQQQSLNYLDRIDEVVELCFSAVQASYRRRSKLKREFAGSIKIVNSWCDELRGTVEIIEEYGGGTPDITDFCLWRMRTLRSGVGPRPDYLLLGSLLEYRFAVRHGCEGGKSDLQALQKELQECLEADALPAVGSLLCCSALAEQAPVSRESLIEALRSRGEHVLAQDFAKHWAFTLNASIGPNERESSRFEKFLDLPASVSITYVRCAASLAVAEAILSKILEDQSCSTYVLGVDAEWEPPTSTPRHETVAQPPRPVILQLALGASHVLVVDLKELQLGGLIKRADSLICSVISFASTIVGFGFFQTDLSYFQCTWSGTCKFPGEFSSQSALYVEAQMLTKNCGSLSNLVSIVFPGFTLDKREQCSHWETVRPLRASQLSYAALDAHVLVILHKELCVDPRERALCASKKFGGTRLMARKDLTDSQRSRECKCVAFIAANSSGEEMYLLIVTRPGYICRKDELSSALALPSEWSLRVASASECVTEFGAAPGGISVCGFRRSDVQVFYDVTLQSEVGRDVVFSGNTLFDALVCPPGTWEQFGTWLSHAVCVKAVGTQVKEAAPVFDPSSAGDVLQSGKLHSYRLPSKHAHRLAQTLQAHEAAFAFREQSEPAFVLDGTCIGLARRLRSVGVDAVFCEAKNPAWIIEQATGEPRRVLLSRDCDLIGQVQRGSATVSAWYIRSQSTIDQLKEIIDVFDLKVCEWQLLSRCVKCNASSFHEVSKISVLGRVPTRTYELYDQFWVCGGCDQLFWKGMRFERATKSLVDLVNSDD